MSPSEIDVVRAFIAAINRRNPSEISDLMAEDHPLRGPVRKPKIDWRRFRGRRRVVRFAGERFRRLPEVI